MVCLLLNKDDSPGLWLSRMLLQTGTPDIKLISVEELVYAPSFSCGFRNGKAFFDIRLNDGFIFNNDTVSKVLNRIHYLPQAHIGRFKQDDRQYVSTELFATFVFLFSILPGQIFNATTGQGFNGRNRSQLAWLLLAQKAGFETTELLYQYKELQTESFQKRTLQSLLYFNNKCYGKASTADSRAVACCLKLGQLSEDNILEIFFTTVEDKILFATATTLPGFGETGFDFISDLKTML